MEISENQNIQIHRTTNELCNICKKNYIDPVACTSCKSLFCKNCCNNFESCPVCNFYPFKVMKKEIYDRFLKALRLFKLYKFALERRYNCNCVLCNYRCHKNSFLEHLLCKHKDFAIDVFNRRIINSNKQKLLTQIFNQS